MGPVETVSDFIFWEWFLRPHESQHTRPPCPSPPPGVYSDSCPSSQWYHPAISSSVVPFSSFPQSLSASRSFPMSQLFTWGGHSTGVSALASFLPKSTQDWSPLKWTGWISTTNRNVFESVLMRWMNLETIIQSAISQKGKNKCHMLTYLEGI